MQSKWFDLKEDAIKLRKRGNSFRQIEKKLGVAKSTLSGWFRNLNISEKNKIRLHNNWTNALQKARVKASIWHKAQKIKRLKEASDSAFKTLETIDLNNIPLLELTLALLYLGEGSKRNDDTAIGSTDPMILKFFVSLLKNVYNVPVQKIRCQLNLRADQNIEEIKKYWSKTLKIPSSNFRFASKDARTLGSKTYSSYKGVCQVRCGNVAIQRKLIHLSNLFCKKVIEKYMGG